MSRLTWTTLAVVAWPLLALLAVIVAPVLPEDDIVAVAVAAVLFGCIPWLGLLWPVWTAVVAHRGQTWRPWMLVSLLGLGVAGVPVECLPAARSTSAGPSVAVLNVNAYSPDTDPGALFALLADEHVQLVVILERRFDDVTGFVRVADDFAGNWPRPSHHTAVYAPPGSSIQARVTEQLGSPTMAMPVAIAWLEEPGVCVLGLHAPPQVPKNATGMAPYISWLVDRLEGGRVARDLAPCALGAPVVLAGDFNLVAGSGPFERLQAAGLRDVLAGAGLFGLTWPSGGGWPDFPVFRLDHVLAGPVDVTDLRKVRVPGSDHQGWVFQVAPSVAAR